jgi:hypothetical protein
MGVKSMFRKFAAGYVVAAIMIVAVAGFVYQHKEASNVPPQPTVIEQTTTL